MHLPVNRSLRAFSLVELMFSVTIASMIGAALCSLLLHFSRTSTTLIGYATTNMKDRLSLEVVGRDIREAKVFLQLSSTNILLFNTNLVRLSYDVQNRQLNRTVGATKNVMLSNCDGLKFSFYERNNTALNFENLLPSVSTNCRIVQMNWVSIVSSNKQNVFSVSNSVKFLNRRVL